MERWPNFFIVGATKAGTTSLYHFLNGIPQIHMSPVKEPRYFMPALNGYINQIQDTQQYLSLFADANDAAAVGEATTGYLASSYACEQIHKQCPNARIIMSLRDPIERTFSHYLMKNRNGRTDQSIREECEDIVSGKRSEHVFMTYCDKVLAYQELFGRENVQVLIFEEWVTKPKEVTEDMLNFLGIAQPVDEVAPQTSHYNPYRTPRSQWARKLYGNPALKHLASLLPKPARWVRDLFLMKAAEKPALQADDREYLKSLYWDDVQELEHLLGKALPWKNFRTSDVGLCPAYA